MDCGDVLEVVGLPAESCAGSYLARDLKMRQVVLSSVREPLDPTTEQSATRPLGPTVRTTRTVPCSSFSIALCG